MKKKPMEKVNIKVEGRVQIHHLPFELDPPFMRLKVQSLEVHFPNDGYSRNSKLGPLWKLLLEL